MGTLHRCASCSAVLKEDELRHHWIDEDYLVELCKACYQLEHPSQPATTGSALPLLSVAI